MLGRGLVPPDGECLLERPVSGDADAFQLLSAELLQVTLLSKDGLVAGSADGMTPKAASMQHPDCPFRRGPLWVTVTLSVRPVALAIEAEAALVILGSMAQGKDQGVLHRSSHSSLSSLLPINFPRILRIGSAHVAVNPFRPGVDRTEGRSRLRP
jgi:hypothetical protein